MPSASDAVALIAIAAGALKDALDTGLVILTVGATFGVDTDTTTDEEVVEIPELSVAFAVIV